MRNGSENDTFSETTGSFNIPHDHHFNTNTTSPRGKSKERKFIHQEVASPYSSKRRKNSTEGAQKQGANPKLGTKIGAKLEAMTKKYANNLQ